MLSLVTATGLILATDRFGRRLVVFAASVSSSVTVLLVGVLGQVGHTKPLQDFLIFVVCIWALGNNARESLAITRTDFWVVADTAKSDSSAGPLWARSPRSAFARGPPAWRLPCPSCSA